MFKNLFIMHKTQGGRYLNFIVLLMKHGNSKKLIQDCFGYCLNLGHIMAKLQQFLGHGCFRINKRGHSSLSYFSRANVIISRI